MSGERGDQRIVPRDLLLRQSTRVAKSWLVGDNIPKILILIPGSRSLAQWCIDIEAAAEKEGWGFKVQIVPYTPPAIWAVVLWPFQFRRNRQVRVQLDDMFRALPPNAEIFMAAHSYGTYVLTRWLRRHYKVIRRVEGIFMLSGIARRKHLACVRNACNVLVNDVAVDDRLPSWAAGLNFFKAFDDIGSWGVVTGTARARDRYFDGDHAALIRVEHFRQNIAPAILGAEVPAGVHSGPRVPELFLSRVRALKWLLATSLACLAVVGWQIAR